jgi:hypothetical protein
VHSLAWFSLGRLRANSATTHPELQASFFLIAPDVHKGLDLGAIDMRSVAPTIAHLLGIPLPSAELKPLPVL